MRFSFIVALRYLFSKSSQTVVNKINSFAIIVLIVSSSALLIVLSGFEGLKEFGMSFYDQFEPDFKILPEKGKTLKVDEKKWRELLNTEGVLSSSKVIEEKIFFGFEGKNQGAYIRGVSPIYNSTNPVDSLIVIGEWIDFNSNSVVLGYGLSSNLGVGVYDYSSYLELSAPKKGKLSFKEAPFKTMPAFVNGIFQISEDIDKKYAFCSIDFARELLSLQDDEFSYVSVRVNAGYSEETLLSSLKKSFNDGFVIQSRIEQNPALYKMIKTENLAIYLIFSLVIIIALFNLIGSLLMVRVDKAPQLKLLFVLGEKPKNIQRIFLFLGLLVTLLGSIGGVFLGVVLVCIQDLYPFVYVPGTSLAYPVSLILENIFIVLVTVFVLGSLTSFWATRGIKSSIK